MRFNFKKVASVLASAIMLSSTVGFATAASYPAPFVVSGTPDGAIVVGANADAKDWAAAVDVSSSLSGLVSTENTDTETIGGDAKTLASGSDLMYLNDDLAENVATITDSDLATILADLTFTDDAGTNHDYEQTVTVGTSTDNGFAFSDSDNDLDDPTLIVQLASTPATKPMISLKVDFETALDFTNATNSEGEVITLFGKDYTIGTATDADTLVLLGGASETTVNVGETITTEVSGESYEVGLVAISTSDTAPEASITVNGESKTFAQGNQKKVAGIDVYAKTVFKTGDNQGYVILQLGSDKLTIESGSAVMIGSDNTEIEGTTAYFNDLGACTTLEFNVSATDNDVNHVMPGESFVDPIFGTISLDFVKVVNGPDLDVSDDISTTRKTIAISTEGTRELGLTIETPGNSPTTVPLAYRGSLQDDDSKPIHIVEGADIDDEEYFILNSGNYQFFMKATKVALAAADSDFHFKDVITGTSYTDKVNNDDDITATEGTTTTFTLNSQTFTVSAVDADTVKVYSSDYNLSGTTGVVSVYPYLGLFDGKDHVAAIVDDVSVNTVGIGTTLAFPTGTYTVVNLTVGLTEQDLTTKIGSVVYNITGTYNNDTTLNLSIGVATAIDGSDNTTLTDPAVLFVEDEDKSEAVADTKNAVLLKTTDDGSYSESGTPVFSGTSDTDGFDGGKHTGYLTNYGTYVVKDTSDSDQTVTWLTYPKDQMYAELFVSETGTTIIGGAAGTGGQVLVVKDSEVSSVSDKNLLVIGGSCINTVAATILGSTSPLCGDDFTTATTVGAGGYILKSVESPYNPNKVAMLVAGYHAVDTQNAVAKLKEGAMTDKGTEDIFPKTTA